MSKRSVRHATFTIERVYPVPRERVYKAWSHPESKGRWFVGPDEWKKSDHKMDFRVGGRETVSGGPPGKPVHYFNCTYQDIVPNERIVSTYDMHLDKVRISVSLATVELKTEGGGTRLIYTEQGAFLDDFDDPALREEGTRALLDNLGKALERESKH
jgi:uncharacterized protein YndB with AHSA1/START domain